MLRAAERGVRVRLLLDDYGAGNKDNALVTLDGGPLTEAEMARVRRIGDYVYRIGKR